MPLPELQGTEAIMPHSFSIALVLSATLGNLENSTECWNDMRLTIALQKAFSTNYGLTAKPPKNSFKYTQGTPKEHAADNGSGIVLYREFCDNCGSFILEYGVRAASL